MLVQHYDPLVVGARIAGATAAALLGDASYRVLLVDRAIFPSATLSTHLFRGAGLLSVLARLHLLDHVLALDAPLLQHCYLRSFVGPDGRKADGAEFSQREDELAYVLPSDAGMTMP